MKNLENYGVLELNAQEIKGIDGGRLPSTLESTAYMSLIVAHAVVDFFEGAIDRFNRYR